MSDFRLSLLAEDDLVEIGDYTQRRWGAGQANRYLDGLEHCCLMHCCLMLGCLMLGCLMLGCLMLAANPELGRVCDDVRVGLRRMEHASHVVFFRVEPGGDRDHPNAPQEHASRTAFHGGRVIGGLRTEGVLKLVQSCALAKDGV